MFFVILNTMDNKIFIFDFDGTIADTEDVVIRVYNKIAAQNNFKQVTKDALEDMRSKSALENFRESGISVFKLPYIVREMRAGLKHEIPNMRLITGVKEALQNILNQGRIVYILSTNSKENIQAFFNHNNILGVSGVFPVSNIFGKHVKIKSLLKANGWDPQNVYYIGDEVRDLEAAKKAGVVPIAVTWGYNSESALIKAKPAKILRSPIELGLL